MLHTAGCCARVWVLGVLPWSDIFCVSIICTNYANSTNSKCQSLLQFIKPQKRITWEFLDFCKILWQDTYVLDWEMHKYKLHNLWSGGRFLQFAIISHMHTIVRTGLVFLCHPVYCNHSFDISESSCIFLVLRVSVSCVDDCDVVVSVSPGTVCAVLCYYQFYPPLRSNESERPHPYLQSASLPRVNSMTRRASLIAMDGDTLQTIVEGKHH